MSKKILLTGALTVLLIVFNLGVVSAQTAPLQEGRAAIRSKAAEVKDRAKEMIQKGKEKVQEARKKLEDKRAERVANFNRRMLARFEAAINRLENVASRLDSRLGKLAKDGQDVTDFRIALDVAKSKVASAKTALGEIKLSLEAVAVSETPKTDFETARGKLDAIKDAIKQAHAALVDVIKSIKGSSEKEKSGSSNNSQ